MTDSYVFNYNSLETSRLAATWSHVACGRF